jgi:tRNA(Ile)-lysidine synthase
MKKSRQQMRQLPAKNTRSPKISRFAQRLRREWRELELPGANETVVVAVSGGADSVALLLALDELIKSKKLALHVIVAHLNHKLRGQASDDDARWVASLAKALGHDAKIASVNVGTKAVRSKENLEQAARRARYDFLERTAKAGKARLILTAHTIDDQAETILLNLLRGSGAAGLSGIEVVRPLRTGCEIKLVRPLLSWAKRADTEKHCLQRSVDFRIDEMNSDPKFARVRMRNRLIPLMKEFNPRFVESLARAAEILREDDLALESAAAHLLELSANGRVAETTSQPALRTDLLRLAPAALRRRALRRWIASCRGDLRRLEYSHIVSIEKLLFNQKSGRLIELPGGGSIRRRQGRFIYQAPKE